MKTGYSIVGNLHGSVACKEIDEKIIVAEISWYYSQKKARC